MSLEKQTARALGWSGVERLTQGILGGAVHVILARLLAPEDFGLIAMLLIFLELGRSVADSGFSAALIQSRETSEADLSSVFFFNLFVATALAATLIGLAPVVSSFYEKPLLQMMLAALSLRLVLDALGTVQAAILSRQLQMRALTMSRVPATITGGLTGILLAVLDFGGWALIGQVLVQSTTRSALLWQQSDWRPSWRATRVQSLKRLAPFGSRMLAAALLDKLARNIYLTVIGKRFPPASLGFYYQARKYQAAPAMFVTRVLNHVLLPLLSSIQTDNSQLARGSEKGSRILAFTYFPAIIGLMAIAEPLVEVLLTAKWLPAVPYFRLLCLASLFMPHYALNHGVIKAKGAAGSVLRIEVTRRSLELLILFVTYRWGITWMIIGQVAAAMAGWILSCWYMNELVDFGLRSQARQATPYLALAAVMGVAVYAVTAFGWQPLQTLLTQILLGLVLYLFTARVLKLRALRESLSLAGKLN